MNKRKSGIVLWILGGCLMALSLIGFIAYGAILSNTEEKMGVLIIVSVIGVVISLVLLIIGYILSFVPDKQVKEKIALYSSYPVNKDVDYKQQLDMVRANFNADNDPAKNRIGVFNFTNSGRCFDFNAINCGKVYYAYLVSAFESILSNKNMARMTMPAVFVYSTDEYFETNPLALKKIANELFKNRGTNILKDDSNFFTNVKLPAETTDGREVYVTTVMAYRPHLPLYCISDGLVPVIAAPDKSPSVFIADLKYWTKQMIGNYAHGVSMRAKTDEESQNDDDPFNV